MHIFIIPLVVMVVSQGIKLLLEIYHGTFEWSHINSYGGMPSSHSALVTSLAVTAAYSEGVASAAFAISVVLFIVIIRDAMGFRYQLGVHGKILNQLIKELPDREEHKFPVLSEKLGHTPAEVAVGVLVGILGAYALIPFIG